MLSNKFLVMLGVMYSFPPGYCTLKIYSATLVTIFILPPGRRKHLLEAWLVQRHVLSAVQTLGVQALSATVEGIEPSSMPQGRRTSSSPGTYCCGVRRMSAAFATVSGLH